MQPLGKLTVQCLLPGAKHILIQSIDILRKALILPSTDILDWLSKAIALFEGHYLCGAVDANYYSSILTYDIGAGVG